MYHRKVKQQWLLIPILITTITFSSLLLLNNSEQKSEQVYLVSSTTIKHTTKSMKDMEKMDEINQFNLLLNQIPNCGSEVLNFLLQKLQGFNSYRHVRLKVGTTTNRLDLIEQEQFVNTLYRKMREVAVPLAFVSPLRFINFSYFDKQSPTYINIVREPTDKLLSRSLYQNDKDNVIECLIKENCNYSNDLTVPYFCGNEDECFSNDDNALQIAKKNVEKYYPVVGVLEEMNTTLEVFENKLPYFFKGAQSVYKNKMIGLFLERLKNTNKSIEIKQKLSRILGREIDFYNWVKSRLFTQLQTIK